MSRSTSSFVSRVSSARYVELEIEIGSDELHRLVVDGVPLPPRVLRYMALQEIRALTEKVRTGERRARELSQIDAAIDATDSHALWITFEASIDADGSVTDFEDVEIDAQVDQTTCGKWDSVKVTHPSAYLVEWMKERAEAQIRGR